MSDQETPPPGGKKSKFVPLTVSKEKLEELDEQYEDILVMRGDPDIAPWLAVVRRPTRQEAIAYKTHHKRQPETANEVLVRAICVYPDPKVGDDFDRQVRRWPFFVDGLMDTESFRKFIGLAVDESVKR